MVNCFPQKNRNFYYIICVTRASEKVTIAPTRIKVHGTGLSIARIMRPATDAASPATGESRCYPDCPVQGGWLTVAA